MFVLGVFGPVLFVAVPMLAVAMIIYMVAHYCISLPLSRESQQGDGSSGMQKVESSEISEQMNHREGKQTELNGSQKCKEESFH